MKVNIAVVQFEINQYEPDYNLMRAEKFIAQAAESKADIIVFPEDFITGGLNDDEVLKLSDSKNKYKNIFQNLARKYKIDIVAGSIIEKTKVGNFNVCYYIDSNGKVKGRYEKINLWITERNYLNQGSEISVFNTKFGKIGLAICWDLIHPQIFKKIAIKGARIVFCPSLWYKGKNFSPYIKHNENAERDHINALCLARAVENNIILVFSNAVGNLQIKTTKSYFDEAIGHSQITTPINGVLKKLNYKKEEMFIQEVDTDILKDAERAYKIRYDIKNRIL